MSSGSGNEGSGNGNGSGSGNELSGSGNGTGTGVSGSGIWVSGSGSGSGSGIGVRGSGSGIGVRGSGSGIRKSNVSVNESGGESVGGNIGDAESEFGFDFDSVDIEVDVAQIIEATRTRSRSYQPKQPPPSRLPHLLSPQPITHHTQPRSQALHTSFSQPTQSTATQSLSPEVQSLTKEVEEMKLLLHQKENEMNEWRKKAEHLQELCSVTEAEANILRNQNDQSDDLIAHKTKQIDFLLTQLSKEKQKSQVTSFFFSFLFFSLFFFFFFFFYLISLHILSFHKISYFPFPSPSFPLLSLKAFDEEAKMKEAEVTRVHHQLDTVLEDHDALQSKVEWLSRLLKTAKVCVWFGVRGF
jgi:hypothetical protein